MEGSLNLFADALNDIANGPHGGSSFHALTEGLLRRLAEKGLTLEQCAGPKMLDRSKATLEGHCREYGIAFPDYVPANMRKHVRFVQSGDYLELTGAEVDAVAKLLNIVATTRGGVQSCAVPIHAYEGAKATLKAAWFEVSKAKAPKRKREPEHA